MDNILVYLESLSHTSDVIAFCETWLSVNDSEIYNIESYNGYFVSRQNRIGGRVAIFVKDIYNVTVVEAISLLSNMYNNDLFFIYLFILGFKLS